MTDSVIPTVTAPIPTKPLRSHKDGKAARIRKLLGKKSYAEIAKIVGTTPGYVYGVARRAKNNPKKAKKPVVVQEVVSAPRKVGRPRKAQVHYVDVLLPQPQPQAPTLWERIKAVFTGANHA